MPVNADKPHRWKADIAQSVDTYNDWFLNFAPQAYRDTRTTATDKVEQALRQTRNLTDISPFILRAHPDVLPILRAATAPPIARDRLIGLTGVTPGLVRTMELRRHLPPKGAPEAIDGDLTRIGTLIARLADRDIFSWLDDRHEPDQREVYRAASVVADRLCGAQADPIIRNAQEQRQLRLLRGWLESRGYTHLPSGTSLTLAAMPPQTFAFRLNAPVRIARVPMVAESEGGGEEAGVSDVPLEEVGLLERSHPGPLTTAVGRQVNIPIDVAVMPRSSGPDGLPLLIEAKSAGDYTNTNKRRKEEAMKMVQLRDTYGGGVHFTLFLCGYFDSGYLGYEAAEGIDWVWEHRIDDLAELGL